MMTPRWIPLVAMILTASALATAQEPVGSDAEKLPQPTETRLDLHGDDLPAGALARLGTVRWRHGNYLGFLAVSPDGKHIITQENGGQRQFYVWDAATGREVRRFGA